MALDLKFEIFSMIYYLRKFRWEASGVTDF